LKKKLGLAFLIALIGWVGWSWWGTDGHSVYSPMPGVYLQRVDKLSAAKLISMGWVDDVDGDQYPDLIVHERPPRGPMEVLSNIMQSNSTKASTIKLRSGLTGEVLQQLDASGEKTDIFRAPFGILPHPKRMGALRRLSKTKAELTDGSRDLGTLEYRYNHMANWTSHPETLEWIEVRPAAHGIELIGSQNPSAPMSVTLAGEPKSLVWVLDPDPSKSKHHLLLMVREDDVLSERINTLTIDWEARRIVSRERLSIPNLARSIFPYAEMGLYQDQYGDLSVMSLWDLLGDDYIPIKAIGPFQGNNLDAGRALFVTAQGVKPMQLLYWDTHLGKALWTRETNHPTQRLNLEDARMSVLADYNGDGISEIALSTYLEASDWLNLKTTDGTVVAWLLDGATGKPLTPNP
jgi:hypothetical protein